MKQLHILLTLALFFTTIGFLLGQRQSQSQQEPTKTKFTERNQIATQAPTFNETEIKNSIAKNITAQNFASISSVPSATKDKEECIPFQSKQNKGFISEADLNQITNMLTKFTTNEERVSALSAMFETNRRTPDVDSDSAIIISDFFRNDKKLESFIPQQVSCHSNICKVDLPAVDASEINHLMETLSHQLSEQKLKASHILLADDASHGSTKLYVSLLPDESQSNTTQ